VEIAQKRYESAQWNLANRVITSPIDGRIQNLNLFANKHINKEDLICRIVDERTIKLFLQVKESEFPNWQEQQQLNISFKQIGDSKYFLGTIQSITFLYIPPSNISPRNSGSSGNEHYREGSDSGLRFQIIIDIPNPDETIKMAMEARIRSFKQVKIPYLTITDDCIIKKGEENFVIVVRDNRCHSTQVEIIETRNDKQVLIKSGLSPNDLVIIAPVPKLKERQEVEVVEVVKQR